MNRYVARGLLILTVVLVPLALTLGVIADRREHYNDSVYRYNARIAQVPAVLLAWLFDWRPRTFFRAEPGDEVRPDATLRPARPTTGG